MPAEHHTRFVHAMKSVHRVAQGLAVCISNFISEFRQDARRRFAGPDMAASLHPGVVDHDSHCRKVFHYLGNDLVDVLNLL